MGPRWLGAEVTRGRGGSGAEVSEFPLYYDYILEINLTKRQKVYDWFYSVVMILCYLIKIDVEEIKCKCLSSTISHISKNDILFCYSQRLKNIANNRIDANLMIRQYTVFRYLHQLSQNIGSNTFIRSYSSHFVQKNTPRKGTENAYTICWFRCTAELLRK